MQAILAIRDVQILLGCIPLALLIAWLTAPRKTTAIPVWPTRLYLFIIDMARVPGLGEYSRDRRAFTPREQFLTCFFVWFFILFAAAVFAFGCDRLTSC